MITRLKKSLTAVPSCVIAAAEYLASIGETQRKINALKRRAKEDTDRINAELARALTLLTKERDTFFTALYTFAQANVRELTAKLRSVRTASGVFGWRWTPPYVELAEGITDEQMIARLQKQGLHKFVRVKYELDREALLEDRPSVAGISYIQREEFFAKPKLLKADGRAAELSRDATTEAIDV